jgi:hypothetical protein
MVMCCLGDKVFFGYLPLIEISDWVFASPLFAESTPAAQKREANKTNRLVSILVCAVCGLVFGQGIPQWASDISTRGIYIISDCII